jgi:integrative and conjugative element protein (TIGR02256 family)
MLEIAQSSPNKETGGILMGIHRGRDIIVSKVTDAGPNARRSACGFLRDTDYCQAALVTEFAASGVDYVGEWHTHVVALPRPSPGDLATLASIILDPDYHLPSFTMALGVVSRDVVQLLFYLVTIEHNTSKSASDAIVLVEQVQPLAG